MDLQNSMLLTLFETETPGSFSIDHERKQVTLPRFILLVPTV